MRETRLVIMQAHHNDSKSLSQHNQIGKPGQSLWIEYLLTSIVPLVSFTGTVSTPLNDIKPLLYLSPALRHACAALGAMFSLKGLALAGRDGSKEDGTPFGHYALAVTQVQSAIAHPGNMAQLPTLWAVFLLSLFELMADATGLNWIKHTLSGISQILEVIGPGSMQQGAYRRFFLEVRVSEVSRSLITTSESILSLTGWKALRGAIWDGKYIDEWHPNEMLIDLMIDISDLGWR